jgi:PadR family transcriptional regulator PadR
MAQSNPPFMSGVPELLLLRLLNNREMYGYELVRSIREVTSEAISLGEGVIYPTLHSLERNGSLKSKRKPVGGRTRVYYSVTKKGCVRKRMSRRARATVRWSSAESSSRPSMLMMSSRLR